MYSVEQQIKSFETREHQAEICVVGGGLAGLCAAVAAARQGAKTVLIHDRPVLGGNASSEVRMWVCGAHGGAEVAETGILEEIHLDNVRRNPQLVYPVWDSVLYEKVTFCPNLTLLLNASCNGGRMADERLASVTAWQLTTQIRHTVEARIFIDCSGDSVLAPVTGARVRVGREGRDEFGENIAPETPDARTMGNSLLLQFRETDTAQPFVAPRWAYKFRHPSDLPHRLGLHGSNLRTENFWWLEIGGLNHTIRDAEAIRDELMKIGYGVADYLKNYHPAKETVENWALEWMGTLPGKRENIRYVGEHLLTQNDIEAGGNFPDVVAYGGWSMDDHHPAGLLYPGAPTIFHRAPSPYGIPFRSLYSKTVPNLLFAGRNISATHLAMASTRVMATTSLMGQAVGTAAAICVREGCDPAAVFPSRINVLQQQLMDDDILLPGRTRAVGDLTQRAVLTGGGAGLAQLRDGHDRAHGAVAHAWQGPLGEGITFAWPMPEYIGGLRLVFDSDLARNRKMPCSYPRHAPFAAPPPSLIRQFRVAVQDQEGRWRVVASETDNHQRLVRFPLGLTTRTIRLIPETTWGADEARIFSVDVLREQPARIGCVPEGEVWAAVVSRARASTSTEHAVDTLPEFLNKVQLHNFGGVEPTADGTGAWLYRLPRGVRDQLDTVNPKGEERSGAQQMRNARHSEIRFVLGKDVKPADVQLHLQASNGACLTFFWGDVMAGTSPLQAGAICAVMPISHGLLDQQIEHFPATRFANRVCRVVINGGEVSFHGIEGDVRPPLPEELAPVMLSYGTSISQGAAASRSDLGWNALTARTLGYDLINLGSGGTAYCEPAIADYMAELDWNLCVLEISVNMNGSGFTIEQFSERAGYLIDKLARSHPEAPIVCISLLPVGTGDLWAANRPRTQAFRDALAELVKVSEHKNVHFVSGLDLLSFTGLSADLLHPSDHGMIEIASKLSSRIRQLMDKE